MKLKNSSLLFFFMFKKNSFHNLSSFDYEQKNIYAVCHFLMMANSFFFDFNFSTSKKAIILSFTENILWNNSNSMLTLEWLDDDGNDKKKTKWVEISARVLIKNTHVHFHFFFRLKTSK